MKKKILMVCIIIIALGIGIIIVFKHDTVKQTDGVAIQNNIYSNSTKNEKIEYDSKLEQARINEDNTIYFPDSNLEKAIKASLKIDHKITQEEAKKVTELYMENCNIKNIEGIEFFTNLKVLNIMKNKIKDISNIRELTNLERLFIGNNVVKDISAISNLKKLEVLNIGYNEITDISPIKDLEYIDYPFINGNPITNFEILYNKVETMSVNSAKSLKLSISDSYIIGEKARNTELFSKNQIAVEEMKKWVKDNIRDEMSDVEKEYKIVNHIMEKIEYVRGGEIAVETNVYDTYIEGKSVCFGYALIFQYLANFAGLENYKVQTNLSIEDIDNGLENHVWNIVKIDDKYYQLDITWADDTLNYAYINVSNETMELLHNNQLPIFGIDAYPETNMDMPEEVQEKYQEYRFIED